jgi:hypothetical protein
MRSVPITVMLPPEHLLRLRSRARRANVSLSAYVRAAVLGNGEPPPAAPVAAAAVAGSLAEIGQALGELAASLARQGGGGAENLALAERIAAAVVDARRRLLGLAAAAPRRAEAGDRA